RAADVQHAGVLVDAAEAEDPTRRAVERPRPLLEVVLEDPPVDLTRRQVVPSGQPVRVVAQVFGPVVGRVDVGLFGCEVRVRHQIPHGALTGPAVPTGRTGRTR